MIVNVRRNLNRNPRKTKRLPNRIRPGWQRTKFPVKVINDPITLMKMGYEPSMNIKPQNDYDVPNLTNMEVA